jgi:hypothetical protein
MPEALVVLAHTGDRSILLAFVRGEIVGRLGTRKQT